MNILKYIFDKNYRYLIKNAGKSLGHYSEVKKYHGHFIVNVNLNEHGQRLFKYLEKDLK